MKTYFYLSFCGDEGFLGACTVEGQDIASAIIEAHRLKINPGGEVLGVGPLSAEDVRGAGMPINKLLSKDEIPGATRVDRQGVPQ